MIIWRGFGILVIFITMAAMIAFQSLIGAVFGQQFYKTHDWPKGAALLLAAVAVYFTGQFFNGKPGRVMIDKATGRELTFRRVHSLFFIPMEYWGYILAVAGFILLFVHLD
jgi:hypothetical protein